MVYSYVLRNTSLQNSKVHHDYNKVPEICQVMSKFIVVVIESREKNLSLLRLYTFFKRYLILNSVLALQYLPVTHVLFRVNQENCFM
jgi:hypothetical protein